MLVRSRMGPTVPLARCWTGLADEGYAESRESPRYDDSARWLPERVTTWRLTRRGLFLEQEQAQGDGHQYRTPRDHGVADDPDDRRCEGRSGDARSVVAVFAILVRDPPASAVATFAAFAGIDTVAAVAAVPAGTVFAVDGLATGAARTAVTALSGARGVPARGAFAAGAGVTGLRITAGTAGTPIAAAAAAARGGVTSLATGAAVASLPCRRIATRTSRSAVTTITVRRAGTGAASVAAVTAGARTARFSAVATVAAIATVLVVGAVATLTSRASMAGVTGSTGATAVTPVATVLPRRPLASGTSRSTVAAFRATGTSVATWARLRAAVPRAAGTSLPTAAGAVARPAGAAGTTVHTRAAGTSVRSDVRQAGCPWRRVARKAVVAVRMRLVTRRAERIVGRIVAVRTVPVLLRIELDSARKDQSQCQEPAAPRRRTRSHHSHGHLIPWTLNIVARVATNRTRRTVDGFACKVSEFESRVRAQVVSPYRKQSCVWSTTKPVACRNA